MMGQIDTLTIYTTIVVPFGVYLYCCVFEDVNLLSQLEGRHFMAIFFAAICAFLGAYLVGSTDSVFGSTRAFSTLAIIPSVLGSAFLIDRYIVDLNSPVSFGVYFWIGTIVVFIVLLNSVIAIM